MSKPLTRAAKELLHSEIMRIDKLKIIELRKEIDRKGKLIEQMREALEWVLEGAIHDFHYVCQHRDNCLCWGCQKARIKAALATERGRKNERYLVL